MSKFDVKPVLLIKIPENLTEEDLKMTAESFDNHPLSKEYHVIIVQEKGCEGFSIAVADLSGIEYEDEQELKNKILAITKMS